MNLYLDCGNTRLKWALASVGVGVNVPAQIVRRGACDYAPAALADWCASIADTSLQALHFASVVSSELEQEIFAHLQPLGLIPQRFTVSACSGSLINGYASPQTLGVDRWAAAIGAWSLVGGACLVVSTGTATTIDLIEVTPEGGRYRGGLILPGIDLMLESLHQRAARLPQAEGCYRPAPDVADNTHDAILCGAIEATCGAIERMGRRLPEGAPWLLTGGRAPTLQEALGKRLRCVDDLVLEGLAVAHSLDQQRSQQND